MQSEVEKLVARLRHLVSLNEPWNGGPYQGVAATACVEAMDEAASLIERLCRENERLREALTEISSPTQSLNLLWWQKRARRALAGEDVQG